MSILPVALAAQLIPTAFAAGKAATDAMGSFAHLLAGALESPSNSQVSATNVPASAPNGGWPADLSSLLWDFASAFNRLLTDHHLNSAAGVQLQLGEAGDMQVAGTHPDGPAIQTLLAGAPQLAELFRSIAAQFTANRKAQEFATFQNDPNAARENFPFLFPAGNAPKFQMRLQGENAAASFA